MIRLRLVATCNKMKKARILRLRLRKLWVHKSTMKRLKRKKRKTLK